MAAGLTGLIIAHGEFAGVAVEQAIDLGDLLQSRAGTNQFGGAVKITIDGTKARLYVHDAAQPTLTVNDLKQGDAAGGVALWIGPGTVGYFRGLKVSPR